MPPATTSALLPLLLVDEPEAGKAQQKMDRKMERVYDLDMAAVRRNKANSIGDARTAGALRSPAG